MVNAEHHRQDTKRDYLLLKNTIQSNKVREKTKIISVYHSYIYTDIVEFSW